MYISQGVKHAAVSGLMTIIAYVGIVGFILLHSGRIAEMEISRRATDLGTISEIVANELRGEVMTVSVLARSEAMRTFASIGSGGELPSEQISALETEISATIQGGIPMQQVTYVDRDGFERFIVSSDGITMLPATGLSTYIAAIKSVESLPDIEAWLDVVVENDVWMLTYLVPVVDLEDSYAGVMILQIPLDDALSSVWSWLTKADVEILSGSEGVLAGDGSRPKLLSSGTYVGSMKLTESVTIDRRDTTSSSSRVDSHILLVSIPYGGTFAGEQLYAASVVSREALFGDYAFMRDLFLKLGVWVLIIWLTYGAIAFWLASGMIPIYRVMQAYMRGNYEVSITKIRGDETGTISQSVNDLLETARNAERDRKNFALYATEQLRTPATQIADRLKEVKQVLKKKRATKSIMAVVETAEKQNRHSLRASSTFLTYMEFGEHYNPEKRLRVDINVLLRRVLNEHAQQIQESQLKLHVKIPNGLFVFVHEAGIVVALNQIIWNAIDYSSVGGKIDVVAERTKEGVAIHVIDEGIGVPVEEASELFQGFYRASNAFYRKNVGSGLGLAITKRIIEAHGGRVSFRSTEGKGSTFTITLPEGEN